MTVIIDPICSGIAGNMIVGTFIDIRTNKEDLVNIMHSFCLPKFKV